LKNEFFPESMMQAEIISIGDEITSGNLLDTNSNWLSRQLELLGIEVLYHVTVGDDLEAMEEVFRTAFGRSDIVISTGGLGPTADDLTRKAIASAAEKPLVIDETVLQHIRELFSKRRRDMPESNRVQAYFPEGAKIVPNPNGTAPGIDLTVARYRVSGEEDTSRLFALPGVPAEMREMWTQTLRPILASLAGGEWIIKHRDIKCFGAGESLIESMLPNLTRRDHYPRVGITASEATIILRIVAKEPSDAECDAAIAPVENTIRKNLGELVFGTDRETLQQVVGERLNAQEKKIAVVEWGTQGAVAQSLASHPQSEHFFAGGIVLTNNRRYAKIFDFEETIDWQTVPDETESIAKLARVAAESLGADLGLVVGPFPEKNSAKSGSPVFMILSNGSKVRSATFPFGGHPELVLTLFKKRALNLVRLHLKEIAKSS
jgi:nicotinamide-nucleotide amidase